MKPLFLSLLALSLGASARAATLKTAPQSPQPGDIITVTVYPSAGEKITGIGMSAFDTAQVKFFTRSDGSARAFVGFPFDRSGGQFPLAARVQTQAGEQIVRTTVNGRTRVYPTQRITMRNRATAAKMDDKAALRAEKALVQSTMRDSYAAPLWRGSWVTPTRALELRLTVVGATSMASGGASTTAPM